MRRFALLLALCSGGTLAFETLAFAGVTVSAPANGSNVATTVQYVASATTGCADGISAIGVYSAPGVLAYSTGGSSLNTLLSLSPGTYQTTVEAWDNCGGASTTPVTIYVSGGASEVQVTAPANNATVGTSVQFVATASSSCSKGVSAMGIYTSPGVLAYSSPGANLNTTLTLNAGTYHTVVQEWDNCGASAYTPITITVGSSGSGGGGVTVTAPQTNTTVSSTVQYVASATTSCSKGVSAMGIYTAPGALAYTSQGASLNALLTLSPGTYHTTVEEWDNCGGAAVTPVTITVSSGGGGSTSGVFTNLHQEPGWNGYALLPSAYNICNSCKPSGPEATWAMTQNISSPSLSGNATRMDLGGETVYSDILWNNHLIGNFSTQGMPDYNQTIVPNLHNFTYDVYFYIEDLGASQALEFDINQFVGGYSYIWGHECRIGGGNEWDIWDNPGQKWHVTGVPCNPVANSWNHLVLQVQRTSDNHLLFQSITLNGVTSTLNYYENPTTTTWYGVTINYQQDGDSKQAPYSVWLDELNFSYW
jgi:major membrane immunogen (membrane-anchored lipoprotein)